MASTAGATPSALSPQRVVSVGDPTPSQRPPPPPPVELAAPPPPPPPAPTPLGPPVRSAAPAPPPPPPPAPIAAPVFAPVVEATPLPVPAAFAERPATLIDSYPKHDAPSAPRLSAHPRFRVKGISPPIAALFVGIAALQGLLAAGIYKYLHRTPAPAASAIAAPSAVATPSAVAPNAVTAPATRAAPPTVTAPAAVTTAPKAEPVATPPAPPPSAESAPAAAAPMKDEAGKPAPTCDQLIGDSAVGENIGAAYEQLKVARKALVQGKVDEAEAAYCKAVRWDEKNAAYYFELAQLLLIRRDGAAAAEWARRGVRLEPASTRGQSLVGDGLARVGDDEGARRAWYAAASVNTPSAEEIQQLTLRAMKEAEQALSTRDYMRAERFFRRAVILDGKNASALRGLATSLLRLGETTNALAWIRKANELAPQDPIVKLILGDALLASGDSAGARNAWIEAQKQGYPDARRRLEHLDRTP
ncbi:MAG: tetratricopeptide repeat protein [Polyangiaceae bacterium]